MRKFKTIVIVLCVLFLVGCGNNEKVIQGDVANNDTNSLEQQKDNNNAAAQEKGQQTLGSNNQSNQKGYTFQYNNTTISVDSNMKSVLEKLGEPASYFEYASCAFDGLDKIYTYSNFEIDTYPKDNEDLISAIILKSDVVTTAEGISVGATKDKLIETYGDQYKDENGMLSYSKDNMKLSFIIENNVVTSIQYLSNVLNES